MLLTHYFLIRTAAYHQFDEKSGTLRLAKGADSKWKIEHFEYDPHITLEVTIAYLTRRRDGATTASLVKANAARSIQALEKLKGQPRVQRSQ